jgi:hypothetical protein
MICLVCFVQMLNQFIIYFLGVVWARFCGVIYL